MVVQAESIEFDEDDPRPLLRHLDRWAEHALASPEGWAEVVERTGQWTDYSPRNQVLLASYGIATPVAGASTWALVPSVDDGREVAIRAGEHALQVRVPVTTDSAVTSGRAASDGFSGSVAQDFRWEPVFAVEQLARRPHRDALSTPAVPSMTDREWKENVRVASGQILGRRPRRIPDADSQLAELASRVALGSNRQPLTPAMAEQSGWLVAERVGRANGPMPPVDPSVLRPRERWQRLEDVRKSVAGVSAAIGKTLEIDLAASPLPRWATGDDRIVAPGRRNYLSRSDVAGLPAGLWSEVGPYTRGEWENRSRPEAVGRAAFLRATPRSYLAVYETSSGAQWKLETAGRGPHLGLVAEGDADSMVQAKADARSALRDRYPDVARAVAESINAPVVSPASGWLVLADGRDDRTVHRTFDERTAAAVAPGPGGQWEVWMTDDGRLRQANELAPTQQVAKSLAEALARGAMVTHAAENPASGERLVADAAANPDTWERRLLVDVIGSRLTDVDAERLAAPDATAAELVELMADSGRIGPVVALRVLHAEGHDPSTLARLVPDIGLPVPNAITEIAQLCGMPRLDAGDLLGATTDELRASGATTAELLAHSPAAILRTLDTRPETWERIGPTLMEAGYDAATALRHVANHAPTPSTLALGIESVTDAAGLTSTDAAAAAFTVIGRKVTPEDLAAVSERFGLDPFETASTLDAAHVPVADLVHAVVARTDGDQEAARTVLGGAVGLSTTDFDAALEPSASVLEFKPTGRSPNAELLSAIAQPTAERPTTPEVVMAASRPAELDREL